jgi:CHAT domain-containing protein/Tfp pilus assembly protein PilF
MFGRWGGWVWGVVVTVCALWSAVVAQEGGTLTEEQRKGVQAEVVLLWEEAQRLEKEGKVREAVAAVEQMLEREQRLYGPRHEDVLGTHLWLAERYLQLEEYAKLVGARKEALAIVLTQPGKKAWEVVDRRRDLAEAELLAGLPEAKRRQLKEAEESLEEFRKADAAGEHQRAIRAAQKAMELRREVVGEVHELYAGSLSSLGVAYLGAGLPAKALPLNLKVVEIRRLTLGESHPGYASGLLNVSSNYRELGDLGSAEPPCRQAVEIMKAAFPEQHVLHAVYGNALHRLAGLYRDMDDTNRAEPLLRQAVEIHKRILGTDDLRYGKAVADLATLYARIDKPDRAEPLYQEAARILKDKLGEAHPDFAVLLSNYGMFCKQNLRDYARAEGLYKESLQIRARALGKEHPDYTDSLNNLGGLYNDQGDFRRAQRLLEEALEIRLRVLGEKHPDYALSLSNLSYCAMGMGNYKLAAERLQPALKIFLKHLEDAASGQSDQQQLVALGSPRQHLNGYVGLVAKGGVPAEKAYEHVLAFKGVVLGRQRAMRAAAARPELRPLLDQLRDAATELAAVSSMTPAGEALEKWRIRLAEVSARKERLERELSRASLEYRELAKPVLLADVRRALPSGCALVDFYKYSEMVINKSLLPAALLESRLGAFVVTAGGSVRFVALGPASQLDVAIESWRKDHGASPAGRQAGQVLREKLWLPVEKEIGQAATVLVCAEEELGKLPIAALPGMRPGSYLIEERQIAMLPAPQAAAWYAEARSDDAAKLLAVGAVNYSRSSGAGQAAVRPGLFSPAARDSEVEAFSYLAGAGEEVAAVESVFRQTHPAAAITVLKTDAATQATVAGSAPDHRYLHFATHGYFAAERFKSALERSMFDAETSGSLAGDQSVSGYHPGLLSGLALAGANQPRGDDDGILTAAEVETVNLSKADLVVLSACETGLGRTAGGEGLLGLQRAFQVAGARTVVASLWNVPDEATKLLMVRFYENMWKKKMGKLGR